jgi:hypothetical protein
MNLDDLMDDFISTHFDMSLFGHVTKEEARVLWESWCIGNSVPVISPMSFKHRFLKAFKGIQMIPDRIRIDGKLTNIYRGIALKRHGV